MTQQNQDYLNQIQGLISQTLLEKKLPALNEGLGRLLKQLHEIEILDERSKITDEQISNVLHEIDSVARMLLRLGRAEASAKQAEHKKWRLN